MLKLIAAAFAAMAAFSVYLLINIVVDSRASVKEDEASLAAFMEVAPYSVEYSDYMDEVKDIGDDLGDAHFTHVMNWGFDKTDRTFYEPEYAELPDRLDAVIAGLEALEVPDERAAEHEATLRELKEIKETLDEVYVLIRREYITGESGSTYETTSYFKAVNVQVRIDEL